ncbi:hypothetical protein [Mesobacillus selenatarsenatis]|uniref:Uncharacterized protein n=1 Tax=Mesobacillus selenatarsenatis (strain DSM 18680 / JCM 14380 / FERM P-15431 / SF-1) TaxID=1321606 RepID=A0A0A8X3J9_MESS1|nr:hypothetical protein [Mesobacillus selenatarsenatis]GAM14493.1 hypothetical protein SAMD00020551_2644 [Mesobacillus selenatarsenatis SF-1]
MKKDKADHAYENEVAKLFGLDEETSLQSVNFATTENSLLNEHFQEEQQK